MPTRIPVSRRAALGSALLAAGAGLGVVRASHAARSEDSRPASVPGLRVLSSERQSERDLVAWVRSSALSRDVRIRILLPTGYDRDASVRYPTLYLLHGSTGDCDSYTDNTSLRRLTATMPLVVVLPDAGRGSWYSNHNHSSRPPMFWEDFHIRQLVPAVDANLRTIGWASARAIAGFSTGGYGATMYGGRHAWMFGSVSSYSGPLDAFDMQWRREMNHEPTLDGEAPGAIYGTEPGHEAHVDLVDRNPSTYAANLVGHRVRIYAGDSAGYEARMRSSSTVYRNALVRAGVKNLGGGLVTGGVHDMKNADQVLARDVPDIMAWIQKPIRS